MLRHAVVILLVFAGIQSSYPLPVERTNPAEVVQILENNGQQFDLTSSLQNAGTLNERSKRTIGLLRDLFPELTKDGDKYINLATLNALNGDRIRISRQALDSNASATDEKELSLDDETGSKDESNFVNDIAPEFGDDDNRNKRFLLDIGGQAEKSGDSGNFLFDVIHLFSSSAPTQSDANSNAGEVTLTKGTSEQFASPDGYTEAIPGPVTRLFVLANRGLSNLIQDLILRIAQTSERVVNFKARIITALI